MPEGLGAILSTIMFVALVLYLTLAGGSIGAALGSKKGRKKK